MTDIEHTHTDIPTEEILETQKIPVSQQLAILGLILLLIFGTGYLPKILSAIEPEEEAVQQAATYSSTPQQESERPDPFADLSIRAASAFVWDVKNQRALYQKDPDKQLPLASITKLMTALVAHELITEDTEIPITYSSILQDGESGLSDGETFTLETLSDLTLLSSSNDGAFAIASAAGALLATDGDAHTFVEAMNIRAEELGLIQTYFRNPTGLDITETESGAYGSARDVTFLMEYILTEYPDLLALTTQEGTTLKDESGARHLVENTNYAVDTIPGIIGSKTGYTDLAGGNLVIAFNAAPDRAIIVSVLNSTRSGRFEDVVKLANTARSAIQ